MSTSQLPYGYQYVVFLNIRILSAINNGINKYCKSSVPLQEIDESILSRQNRVIKHQQDPVIRSL